MFRYINIPQMNLDTSRNNSTIYISYVAVHVSFLTQNFFRSTFLVCKEPHNPYNHFLSTTKNEWLAFACSLLLPLNTTFNRKWSMTQLASQLPQLSLNSCSWHCLLLPRCSICQQSLKRQKYIWLVTAATPKGDRSRTWHTSNQFSNLMFWCCQWAVSSLSSSIPYIYKFLLTFVPLILSPKTLFCLLFSFMCFPLVGYVFFFSIIRRPQVEFWTFNLLRKNLCLQIKWL